MRFLFTRRWVLFAVTVAVLTWLAVQLGQWQFHRLDDRRAENSLVARNLERPPVPLADVLAVDRPVDHDDEWRQVTVSGTWDDAHTIVLKYQTRDGSPGVDVVTPLVTAGGAAVLVDRGWLETGNTGADRPELPQAASGDVTVVGWVRVDATGRATKVADLSTRALSSEQAAKVLPYPVYGGFLDLKAESPEPEASLDPADLPDDTSEGPHFFYGLQWWFFGLLAVTGFGYLAFDEWRLARRKREQDGAQDGLEGAEHPAVDREQHAGHER